MEKDKKPASTESGGGSLWIKLFVLTGLAAAAFGLYWQFGSQLTLENLAAREETLRDAREHYPVLVFGIAFVVYVALTGLSLPGAAGLSLVYGWYFGFFPGFVLVSFASTTGASVAFLLSRYLFRDGIQNRFGERLAAFNRALEREGAFYLFTLRLIPAVPFFVINVVMGLTPIRLRTFWWVSQLGMLPGTLVYLYAGSTVPDLKTLSKQGVAGILSPQLLVAFVMLGLFPLIVKKLVNWFRPVRDAASNEASPRGSPKSGTADAENPCQPPESP